MRVQAGNISIPANAALEPYRRVKVSGGYAAYAGATDEYVGTLERRVLTGDEQATIVPRFVEGTVKMVAAGAIDADTNVYAAANGKVDDTANEYFVGVARTAASGDGSVIEVQPMVKSNLIDALGSINGNVVIDDDFLGDWPAAGTALAGQGPYAWTKTETNALGVISSDEANGVLKFTADAVAEAATNTLYMVNSPIDVDKTPIFEAIVGIFDKGDDASLDIDFGLASDAHATDFDAIAAFASFHLDGNDLSLKIQSDDGTTDVAPVDTTVDLTANTYYAFKIDVSDKADIKFYYRALTTDVWTRLAAASTFTLDAYTGALTPIVLVEKTSNDTTYDVRVDRIRVQAQRN